MSEEVLYTHDELVELLKHLDDETDWETINDFWQAWSPRLKNHRIRRLIVTALAEGPNAQKFAEFVENVRVACSVALGDLLALGMPSINTSTGRLLTGVLRDIETLHDLRKETANKAGSNSVAEIELQRASRDQLRAVVDRLTTCLIGAVDQIQRHNSNASHVTSKNQLEIWRDAITHGRLATNDGSDPGDE
jgi:hypothetical protein